MYFIDKSMWLSSKLWKKLNQKSDKSVFTILPPYCRSTAAVLPPYCRRTAVGILMYDHLVTVNKKLKFIIFNFLCVAAQTFFVHNVKNS